MITDYSSLQRWHREGVILDCNIQDSAFLTLLDRAVGRIPEMHMEDFPSFNIYAFTGKEGAMVMEDNVCFDLKVLGELPEEVQIGIIAHEFVHKFLGHGESSGLKEEAEADQLAAAWGFEREIKAMRKQIGPPTER